MSTEIKLPFGLRNEQLIHISEVERGLACNCICPACHQKLVARKGSDKAHHFAHYQGDDCERATETALHLAAKEILEQEKQLRIPSVTFSTDANIWILFKDKTIRFDEIKLEHKINDMRPDILAYTNGTPLMIEILVTHGIDENKLEQIRQLNISTLEISLENMDRTFDLTDLRKAVLFAISNKRWIYNRLTSQEPLKQILEGVYSQCEFKASRPTGHGPIVLDCPEIAHFSTRYTYFKTEGTNYVYLNSECDFCPFFFDIKFDHWTDAMGVIRETPIVACLGKARHNPKISKALKDGIIPPDWRKLVWED